MNKELIFRKVEELYEQYLEQDSEIMLNVNTDYLFDNLLSIPFCSEILDKLEKKYVIPFEVIEERMEQSYLDYFEDMTGHGQEYYIAYCLQLYKNLRDHNGKISDPYCDATVWIDSFESEKVNRFRLFKTDFIRPIINYITNSIRNESVILYTLNRYKERMEKYHPFHFTDDTYEKELQNDLALYLFDNNHEFYRELDNGTGELDFLIQGGTRKHYGSVLDCNDKPLIVEIKYFKEKLQEHIFKDAIVQLKAYMEVSPSYGCLIAYILDENKQDLRNFEINGIDVIPIYVGKKSASKR